VTGSRWLANGIAPSCCYSFGSRYGPGKWAAFVCPTSIGETGRFESIRRNPRGNERCHYQVTSVRPLQSICRTVGPRAPSHSFSLRTPAPFGRINGPSAVSCIANVNSNSLESRSVGWAPFLSTAATRMVRRGVGFKQIADVLGHRLLETTNIYAKLDEESLRRVALPWPGGQA
jgi:hypothetical protein